MKVGPGVAVDEQASLYHALGRVFDELLPLPVPQLHPGTRNALFEQRMPGTAEHAQVDSRNDHEVNDIGLGLVDQLPRCFGPLSRGDGYVQIHLEPAPDSGGHRVPCRASPVTYAIPHLDGRVTNLVGYIMERCPMVVKIIARQVHAGRGERDLTDSRKLGPDE